MDRPYRRNANDFGWRAGIAFTYAVRSVEGVGNLGDIFAFPNAANIPKYPANDERARVVANWVTDLPYLFGIQFSGLVTLGSGAKKDIGGPIRFNPDGYVRGGFSPPGENFLPSIGGTQLGVTMDAFNVFNHTNLGCYITPAIHGAYSSA